MATLTQTAQITRQGLKYLAIAVVVFLVGRFTLSMGVSVWRQLNPPPPPPPTFGFGELPEISFPDMGADVHREFQLETPTGQLPQTPYTMKVFRVIVERPNLLALDRANTQARSMGFDSEPTALSDTLYRWQKFSPLRTTMDMYIYQGVFTYWTDWFADPGYTLTFRPPSQSQAIGFARRFLENARVMTPDISAGRVEVNFLRAMGSNYTPAVSLSEADFVQVDFYRSDIDELYPVVTLEPDKGIVQVIVSGDTRSGGVISAEYNYWPIEYQSYHTYLVVPARQAWEKLVEGGGYIAQLEGDPDVVVVRRMSLAYLDTYEPQAYLQPVWMLTGDNDFLGYVPAATTNITEE